MGFCERAALRRGQRGPWGQWESCCGLAPIITIMPTRVARSHDHVSKQGRQIVASSAFPRNPTSSPRTHHTYYATIERSIMESRHGSLRLKLLDGVSAADKLNFHQFVVDVSLYSNRGMEISRARLSPKDGHSETFFVLPRFLNLFNTDIVLKIFNAESRRFKAGFEDAAIVGHCVLPVGGVSRRVSRTPPQCPTRAGVSRTPPPSSDTACCRRWRGRPTWPSSSTLRMEGVWIDLFAVVRSSSREQRCHDGGGRDFGFEL